MLLDVGPAETVTNAARRPQPLGDGLAVSQSLLQAADAIKGMLGPSIAWILSRRVESFPYISITYDTYTSQ